MDWELGVHRCRLLPLEWMSNEILLYGAGSFMVPYKFSSHLWWSMVMWEKRMYICVCDWVTLLSSRKLTEHYKPVIMERIKIIIKKNPKKQWRTKYTKVPTKYLFKEDPWGRSCQCSNKKGILRCTWEPFRRMRHRKRSRYHAGGVTFPTTTVTTHCTILGGIKQHKCTILKFQGSEV